MASLLQLGFCYYIQKHEHQATTNLKPDTNNSQNATRTVDKFNSFFELRKNVA